MTPSRLEARIILGLAVLGSPLIGAVLLAAAMGSPHFSWAAHPSSWLLLVGFDLCLLAWLVGRLLWRRQPSASQASPVEPVEKKYVGDSDRRTR
jgi:hypothetical protein